MYDIIYTSNLHFTRAESMLHSTESECPSLKESFDPLQFLQLHFSQLVDLKSINGGTRAACSKHASLSKKGNFQSAVPLNLLISQSLPCMTEFQGRLRWDQGVGHLATSRC